MGVAVGEFKAQRGKKRDRLLRLLTYEVVDGRPIYYRGYRDVLEGKKHPEEVMGSSLLHARLVAEITGWLRERLKRFKYVVASGELGYWIEKGSTWRSLDVAVFRYEDVKDKLESDEYIDVPPVLVVEIDTHAEVENDTVYIVEKIQQLLKSVVSKVLWIFTGERKVLVAERGKEWVVKGWDEDIDLIEGLKLNVDRLLKDRW